MTFGWGLCSASVLHTSQKNSWVSHNWIDFTSFSSVVCYARFIADGTFRNIPSNATSSCLPVVHRPNIKIGPWDGAEHAFVLWRDGGYCDSCLFSETSFFFCQYGQSIHIDDFTTNVTDSIMSLTSEVIKTGRVCAGSAEFIRIIWVSWDICNSRKIFLQSRPSHQQTRPWTVNVWQTSVISALYRE